MNFKEIDELSSLVSELDALGSSKPDLKQFDSIQEKILAVARDDSLSSSFLTLVAGIKVTPQIPYFPEVSDQVRRESWEVGVSQLKKYLNSLIVELRKTAVIVTREDLVAVLDAGLEDGYFEFKSSLRWDLSELKVNTELEFVILKTIAAFANSDGGNLLIGVDDNGNVLGLEADYGSFKTDNGSWDELERYLRDLIGKAFGTQFLVHNLQLCRIPMGDKEICQIRIRKGEFPLFLNKKLKSGEKKEVFYFRLGNQSKDIEKLSGFYEYAAKRYFSKLS